MGLELMHFRMTFRSSRGWVRIGNLNVSLCTLVATKHTFLSFISSQVPFHLLPIKFVSMTFGSRLL